MIFVSSACVRNKTIGASVKQLAEHGFLNIELSGGTQPYDKLEQELLNLQKEYNLNYICHNYFPPPAKPFVVNLASLDDEIYQMSLNHLKKAIRLSEKLGAERFGFHAGFLINIPISQIGKSIDSNVLFDREQAKARFIEGYNELNTFSSIELYIENNVTSRTNHKNFGNVNPFFMSCSADVLAHMEKIEFGLILDIAHLKVSANALGKSLEEELSHLLPLSDYIHVSDNDGLHDSNNLLKSDAELFKLLEGYSFENKIFTIEVYDGLDAVEETFNTIKKLQNANMK